MSLNNFINTNQSIKGSDLIEWIQDGFTPKTAEEELVASKIYYKYFVDPQGNPKNKIYPGVYYYVNYNNNLNPDVYLAYVVRDKTKSPRKIPETLAKMTLFNDNTSHKGKLIREWAYFQNGSSENEFYIEGHEIVSKYLETDFHLRKNTYYFVVKTKKGNIKIFRDLDRSPRTSEFGAEA